MERDAGDLLDRWSIAKLKAERIGTIENKKELQAFEEAVSKLKETYPDINWDDFSSLLVDLNSFIWLFEAGLKSGKEELPNPHYIYAEENKPALVRMGIIATEIKNYNHIRIKIKNLINKLVKEGFQDVKKDHLSE